MWEITDAIGIVILIVLTVADLREKKISVFSLFVSSTAFCVFRLYDWKGREKEYISGAIIGILFLLISWTTKQAIGYADSLIILSLGFYLGFWNTISMLGISFVFSAMTGLFVLYRCGWSRKAAMPFFPFLTIGYLGVLLK